MAEPYLNELMAIVEQAGEPGEGGERILCKHFFSGAAAYFDGHIFMTLTTVGLALKLPEKDCNMLFDQGGKPLQYFPKAPMKKNYVLLPNQIINDNSSLNEWVSRSIDFVRK